MKILEINFEKSFVCNDLDLTDILSKTKKKHLKYSIRQSEVRQLEKAFNLQYGNWHRHEGP